MKKEKENFRIYTRRKYTSDVILVRKIIKIPTQKVSMVSAAIDEIYVSEHLIYFMSSQHGKKRLKTRNFPTVGTFILLHFLAILRKKFFSDANIRHRQPYYTELRRNEKHNASGRVFAYGAVILFVLEMTRGYDNATGCDAEGRSDLFQFLLFFSHRAPRSEHRTFFAIKLLFAK